MFSITFFLAAGIGPVVLLFKGEETLNAALGNMSKMNSMIFGPNGTHPSSISRDSTVTDDFGQTLTLVQPPLAFFVQDMKQAREADIERGLNHAVTQAKAQERGRADPTLQAAQRAMHQGPAVLSPMGMQNGRGF